MNIDDLLNESVIDWTRSTLDPDVFNKSGSTYNLKPHIKHFLWSIVDQIDKKVVDIDDAFLKGSILSFQWLDHSDVDLLIEIEDDIEDVEWKKLQEKADEVVDNQMLPGTSHLVQVYLHCGEYDINNADGVLYLDDRGWAKGPYNLRVNLGDYMSKFQKTVASIDLATGELKRNLIDYDLMKDLPPETTRGIKEAIDEKIEDIKQDVEDIIFQYKHIRDMRHKVFSDDMTPKEIARYGTKNKLPENVIFKMLERYYYLRFMRDLKDIAEDGVEDHEIDDIKQAYDSIADTQSL